MIKDLFILAMTGFLAFVFSGLFMNCEVKPGKNTLKVVCGLISLILYIITIILGIRFAIHVLAVIAKNW